MTLTLYTHVILYETSSKNLSESLLFAIDSDISQLYSITFITFVRKRKVLQGQTNIPRLFMK